MTLEDLKKKRPFKYSIICKKTGKIQMQNHPPILRDLQTWEGEGDIKTLVQTKVCYEDRRYEARLRLWKYQMKKHGYAFEKVKPNLPLP